MALPGNTHQTVESQRRMQGDLSDCRSPTKDFEHGAHCASQQERQALLRDENEALRKQIEAVKRYTQELAAAIYNFVDEAEGLAVDTGSDGMKACVEKHIACFEALLPREGDEVEEDVETAGSDQDIGTQATKSNRRGWGDWLGIRGR